MRILRKVWDVATTILVVLVLILSILVVGSRLLGMVTYTVLSGSMEPAYPVGSLILVKPVGPQDIETGDVITYLVASDTVVTHRVAEIVQDESDPDTLYFRTKGDANDSVDAALTHEKNVIGKPILCVPKVGYLIVFLQRPPGIYILLAAVGLVLLGRVLYGLFKKDPPEGEDAA